MTSVLSLWCVLLSLFSFARSFLLSPHHWLTINGKSRSVVRASTIDNLVIEGDLIPITNNVLIRVKEQNEFTTGGVFIPELAKERPTEGVVIATGSGKITETGETQSLSARVGDNVMYGKYDGTELKYNGVQHQIIKDEDILFTYSENLTPQSVRCVRDNVLLRLPVVEVTSDTGVILTTSKSKEKRADCGEVVNIGPGRKTLTGSDIPIPLQIGDHVRFRNFAGTDIKLDSQEYLVVKFSDILAKW